jgi:tRNA U34 5-carboxymethylaminomethyl modifying enzyme MnmG/GidA
MKSLATLIKLQKTFVDEQRQHLARLLENLERIENSIAQLEIIKVREQAAVKDEAARMTYGAFLKQMIEKGRALETERQTAELAVKMAQEKLAELFEEQKRFETAEAQRIEEEAKIERHLETLELDEIGGTRHERQRAE